MAALHAPAASVAGDPDASQLETLLRCKTDHTRLITKMLAAVCLRDRHAGALGPSAWCEVSRAGLRCATEESVALQARVYLPADLFREYAYAEEAPLRFGINLGAVTECLRILDGGRTALSQPPSLHVRFDEDTATLSLTLVEGAAVTECEISTIDASPVVPLADAAATQLCRVVLRADALREALQELEWGDGVNKDKAVALTVNAENHTLRLTVRSASCGCEMVIGPEALSKVDVAPSAGGAGMLDGGEGAAAVEGEGGESAAGESTGEVRASYRFTHLQAVARHLNAAEEACVCVMEGSVLKIMVRLVEGGQCGYAEYYALPLASADDADGFG